MDRSWISLDYHSKCYRDGVDQFIEFANKHSRSKDGIACPCKMCKNMGKLLPHDVVKEHCIRKGFLSSYVDWYLHGVEAQPEGVEFQRASVSEDEDAQTEGVGFQRVSDSEDENIEIGMNMNSAINTVVEELGVDKLEAIVGQTSLDGIEDAEKNKFNSNFGEAMDALYPGCEDFNVLRFIVKLFKLKVTHGWTDQSLTELLRFFKMVLPCGNKTPDSYYKEEKLITKLGLKYKKIDVCPNDCILYRKEHEFKESCPTCGVSRYKMITIEERKNKMRPPAKILRYFPITERLKRLYSVPWVAEEMCWHLRNRSKEGEMRHPVDSPNWKHIDCKYQSFAAEPRNVRLGLATDGFNPYGKCSSSYSCWPVMCVSYNPPPWLCMKPQFIMLALLVDGPRQPGKDINVFLQPLVDELNFLWRVGVIVKDANTGNFFNMRTVLLWTIHDFPAYGDVSGCKTKGKYACPPCGPQTSSLRLFYGKKTVYMDSRRWFPLSDESRWDTRQGTFNKQEEHREEPVRLSGLEVKEMTQHLKVQWGKRKRKRQEDNESGSCFTNQSILFELDYWEELPIRHNLDVMHIEKNVCENLIAMMFNIDDKTKDNANARKDLKRLGIKKKFWLTEVDGRIVRKPGVLMLKPEEKVLFLRALSNLRVPVGFSSNWKNIVKGNELDLKRMKTHDYHILMQHLFPVLIQHAYKDRKEARHVILSISTFFKALCAKKLNVDTLVQLERVMARTLCELDKICPPSVFVIMMHLPIHLPYEARMCGPVPCRWMFTFERMMKLFKGYVTNNARPEACIAERYLKEETLNYCSGYEGGGSVLQMLESKVGDSEGMTMDFYDIVNGIDKVGPIGGSQTYDLVGVEYEQARNWVLKTHKNYHQWHMEYNKFVEAYTRIARKRVGQIKVLMEDEFIPWLRRQPQFLESDGVFQDIVRGPLRTAVMFNKYSVNGFQFITDDFQTGKSNQNSGVSTNCVTTFRSSAKDKNPIDQSADYYGILKKIIQLKYRSGYTQVLFKCDWVKLTANGVKLDVDTNLKLVNLSNVISSERMVDEPFVLAEAASQVFYSQDPKNPEWHVILEVPKSVHTGKEGICHLFEEIVVDPSYTMPSNVELNTEDEIIFNDPENMMVEVTKKRKKRKERPLSSSTRWETICHEAPFGGRGLFLE